MLLHIFVQKCCYTYVVLLTSLYHNLVLATVVNKAGVYVGQSCTCSKLDCRFRCFFFFWQMQIEVLKYPFLMIWSTFILVLILYRLINGTGIIFIKKLLNKLQDNAW